ncbi:hypothetical protein [Bradyrhizobium diazoefficiens]|uniref:Uncharacterized protein n=1 Tax=Bradyrhizobium diazoefficiens TaxID=1355477 RepID=A0A809WSC1_9BRAD|nr:hypothetical protein XF1B_04970 [Bradyrhizobium diazoefficiens]BCF22544.1 hypothetical protein XF14B_04960 [Bradyrhizobium diazoefficiens]
MKPKPRRIAARPDPEAWSDTDPLSLEEAAALMFPDGPYTASTLRSCYRQGFLEVTILARKLTTNKRAIREMMEAARRPPRKHAGT